MQVINPATGEQLADLEPDDKGSVTAKFNAARAAQPDWAGRPIEERIEIIASSAPTRRTGSTTSLAS